MLLLLILLWIGAAWLIAVCGRNLRFGFWGYFFASVLLTPVIGLLLLIAALPSREARRAVAGRRRG